MFDFFITNCDYFYIGFFGVSLLTHFIKKPIVKHSVKGEKIEFFFDTIKISFMGLALPFLFLVGIKEENVFLLVISFLLLIINMVALFLNGTLYGMYKFEKIDEECENTFKEVLQKEIDTYIRDTDEDYLKDLIDREIEKYKENKNEM